MPTCVTATASNVPLYAAIVAGVFTVAGVVIALIVSGRRERAAWRRDRRADAYAQMLISVRDKNRGASDITSAAMLIQIFGDQSVIDAAAGVGDAGFEAEQAGRDPDEDGTYLKSSWVLLAAIRKDLGLKALTTEQATATHAASPPKPSGSEA